MGAGDQGEPLKSRMDGEPRAGGDRPERDADPDRFEDLLECLSGIGDAGREAKDFLETARMLLRDDIPPVPRPGEVVAYCVRQAADSILESAGSSPEDGRNCLGKLSQRSKDMRMRGASPGTRKRH